MPPKVQSKLKINNKCFSGVFPLMKCHLKKSLKNYEAKSINKIS